MHRVHSNRIHNTRLWCIRIRASFLAAAPLIERLPVSGVSSATLARFFIAVSLPHYRIAASIHHQLIAGIAILVLARRRGRIFRRIGRRGVGVHSVRFTTNSGPCVRVYMAEKCCVYTAIYRDITLKERRGEREGTYAFFKCAYATAALIKFHSPNDRRGRLWCKKRDDEMCAFSMVLVCVFAFGEFMLNYRRRV